MSESKEHEALIALMKGMESGMADAMHILGEQKQQKPQIDLTKITWKEFPEKQHWYAFQDANQDNETFNALRHKLQESGKNLTLGEWYVWLFPDETAIGRKIRSKKQ